MTDIVERLRLFVPHCEDPNDYLEDELLFLKAADEIERLRVTLDQTRRFALSGEMDTIVSDEIERLRAALRDIACDCKHDCADSPLGLSPVTPNCCRNFARAALGEKE